MPKFECGVKEKGIKVCNIDERTVYFHDKATAGTKNKRLAAARRLRKYRFTKADARACGRGKSRFKCMGRRVKAK